MKHTDFHKLHKQLDEKAREELTAAVKAHGNEFIFIHFDENGESDEDETEKAPIIMASTKHMDSYIDFYVSRVTVGDGNYLAIYGFPKDGWDDEHELDSIAHGHLEFIIDNIPETEEVKDVTIP